MGMAGKEKVIMAALVLAYLVSIYGRVSVLAAEVEPIAQKRDLYAETRILLRAIDYLEDQIEEMAGRRFFGMNPTDHRRLEDGDTSVIVKARIGRLDIPKWLDIEQMKIKAFIDFSGRKLPILKEVLVGCDLDSKP